MKYAVVIFVTVSVFCGVTIKSEPSSAKIDKISTRRLSIWGMTLESNLNKDLRNGLSVRFWQV